MSRRPIPQLAPVAHEDTQRILPEPLPAIAVGDVIGNDSVTSNIDYVKALIHTSFAGTVTQAEITNAVIRAVAVCDEKAKQRYPEHIPQVIQPALQHFEDVVVPNVVAQALAGQAAIWNQAAAEAFEAHGTPMMQRFEHNMFAKRVNRLALDVSAATNTPLVGVMKTVAGLGDGFPGAVAVAGLQAPLVGVVPIGFPETKQALLDLNEVQLSTLSRLFKHNFGIQAHHNANEMIRNFSLFIS